MNLLECKIFKVQHDRKTEGPFINSDRKGVKGENIIEATKHFTSPDQDLNATQNFFLLTMNK